LKKFLKNVTDINVCLHINISCEEEKTDKFGFELHL